MTEDASKHKNPPFDLDALARRLGAVEAANRALAEENRRLGEENRQLSRVLERLHGRLDEQREWFREALDEQVAKLEARLSQEVRAREKRARDHILPWLEQHSQTIRRLLEESQRFKEIVLILGEHSREADEVLGTVRNEVDDVKALAGRAVENLQSELRHRRRDIVAVVHDRFDHRMGVIELQQEELNRQVSALVVRLALGEELLDAPNREPPTVSADPGDPASIFPADGLLQGFMGEVGGKPCPVVNARDLHGFLGSKDMFAHWITDQIERARLKENKHFVCLGKNPSKKSGRGGHNRIDYHLTLQGAQHIAMISNTEKGFEVRDYFIECEERYRALRAGTAISPSVAPLPAVPATPDQPAQLPIAGVPLPPKLLDTPQDPLYMACLRLAMPPDCLVYHSRRNDSHIRRGAKILAFLLRTVPKAAETWPFTASHLAEMLDLYPNDMVAKLRCFEARGFLTLAFLGRKGLPGHTYELRVQWENIFAAARELGVNLEALAGACTQGPYT
jgi:phage anti-repressor protein